MRRFRKTVSVDINDTVEVEIESDAVVEFLENCSPSELTEILKDANVNTLSVPEGITINSVNDVLKFEMLSEAFKKYTIFELEEKLK